MPADPNPLAAKVGRRNWLLIEILLGLAYVAFATLILGCMSIDHLESLRGEAARKAWGQFLILWLILVPIPLLLYAGSRLLWRAVARAPRAVCGLVRSAILAFFFAPSLVGAAGPTGAFLLPGPAFLMLILGQWHLKFWLGLLPILIAWPVAIWAYSAWETRRLRRSH